MSLHEVTFDHRGSGTPEHIWQQTHAWRRATVTTARDVLGSARRLVVVCAHPDDETLGCGGLLATAADLGLQVTVVVATAGERSHPDSPTVTGEQLGQRRDLELERAVALLAPSARLVRLHLPDGRVAGHVDDLRAGVTAQIDDLCVLAAPWRQDGHPDHEAVGMVVSRIGAHADLPVLEFPIWAWHWAKPADLPWRAVRRVPLTRDICLRKCAALEAHSSQLHPLSAARGDQPVLTRHVLAHFTRDFETYIDPGLVTCGHLDRILECGEDPWDFDHSWYERRKRAITMACLPRESFDSILEVGCATGALTEQLATRGKRVLAIDASAAALCRARARLGDLKHVRLRRMRVPAQWPGERFDLIVLSEIGYYLDEPELHQVLRQAARGLRREGMLLLVHWRHPIDDAQSSGDQVHRALHRVRGLHQLVHHVEPDFLLDLVSARSVPTIAEREGKT